MKLETKHWVVLAGLLGSMAAQLASVKNGWADTLTPGFVAGLCGQIATTITAIFIGKPGADAELDRAKENTQRALVGLPQNDSPITNNKPSEKTKADDLDYID